MESYNYTQDTSEHIFGDEQLFQHDYASTAQRFFNWLVDSILLWFGGAFVAGFTVALVMYYTVRDQYDLDFENPGLGMRLWYLFGYLLVYTIYYTFCEKVFKGYTLGKLITGTRAIRNDGRELTFKDALLRSLSRIVPFEVFSGFSSSPWHDGWTNTMVIKSR